MPAIDPPRKLLARMPNWLGDCVAALPTLQGIRDLYPDVVMDFWIKDGFTGLGAIVPFINRTFPHFTVKVWRLNGSYIALKNAGYDTALVLPNSFRSAFDVWKLKTPTRIGYSAEMRSPLLTHAIRRPAKHSLHQADYYTNLVTAVYPDVQPRAAELAIPDENVIAADSLLPAKRPLVGIGFGASFGSAKMWPAENFSRLIDMLGERYTVVLFGAKSDAQVEKMVMDAARIKPVSLVGKTDLPTLAGALSRLAVYITNDTGPMHLAAALGVKTLAIFGPTSPKETAPRGDNVTLLYRGARCAPCWKRECPEDHECMMSISVEEVYNTAVGIMESK